MSKLTNFAAAGFTQARGIIGGETITIGASGPPVSVVLNEVDRSRGYQTSGWDQNISLMAVISIADWEASYPGDESSYFSKIATARGQDFRVAGINRGQGFVTIRLSNEKKGA